MGRGGGSRGGGSRGGGSRSSGGSRGGSSRSSSSRSSSRSYSSRSSSSGRSSRSYSSGGGWSSGGLFGYPRSSGPVIINNSGNRGYSNSGRPVYNNSNKSSGAGCVDIALILVMVASIIVLLFNTILIVSSSESQRTPLESGSVIETAYYTDELGWINDESDLLPGLKHFYEKTGVQPYVYITDDVGGDFYDVIDDFGNDLYDDLFEDEAHYLLIFCEKDGYFDFQGFIGYDAQNVIDYEADNIILDKLYEYYWDDLDEDTYFGRSFEEAADEIMKAPPSGFMSIAVPLFIFVLALIIEITIKKKAKQEQRDKELKEMLDKPLETFGSNEAQNLAKKYEDTDKPDEDNKSVKADTEKTDTVVSEPAAPEVPDDKCPKCGSEIGEDNNFCSFCGTKVDKE